MNVGKSRGDYANLRCAKFNMPFEASIKMPVCSTSSILVLNQKHMQLWNGIYNNAEMRHKKDIRNCLKAGNKYIAKAHNIC